jgi:signal recognition particle receptor subunit beta
MKADAVVFVVDSSDRTRVDEAARELKALLVSPDTPSLPIMIFANKTDIDVRVLHFF